MKRIATLSTAAACALTIAACASSSSLEENDVRGDWRVSVFDEAGDSLPTILLHSTTSGWTATLPNREPMAARMRFAGDSMMTEFGPYTSVLRPGVLVTTSLVHRMESNSLMTGTLTAHYTNAGPDSIFRARTEARRIF